MRDCPTHLTSSYQLPIIKHSSMEQMKVELAIGKEQLHTELRSKHEDADLVDVHII